MFRYVPEFILEQFQAKLYEGKLEAFVTLFDVANFTAIGTALQKEGNRGAEELSRFLSLAFDNPIDLIYKYGGFVSLFAGDAFCAIFPQAKAQDIVSVLSEINAHFQENSIFDTPYGNFGLKLRQTICHGTIHWQIFRNEIQNEYVFYGDVMKELAELAACKQDIMFSESAASLLSPDQLKIIKTGCNQAPQQISSNVKPLEFHFDPAIRDKFINPMFRDIKPQNEIRNAAYCFLNLEGVPPETRGKRINSIQILADKYGGFVNKYDATDKGLIAIVIFGLPHNRDKTLERICNFSLEAVEINPGLAVGISCGRVFAGYTGSGEIKEYTALGQPLILAARLMSKAVQGEVLTDSWVWQEMNALYDFTDLGSLSLRGFKQPVRYYGLNLQNSGKTRHRQNRFVGRTDELSAIKELIKTTKENSIVYISGEAGIGKSRLVEKSLADYSVDTHHKFFISCDAILTKPLDAIKQIVRAAFDYDPQSPAAVGVSSFRDKWLSFASDDPQCMHMESVIASLLGYEWEDSFWSSLSPQNKPEQTRAAFIRYMKLLASTKPVIIHLDDGQWLDGDSKSYFQSLTKQGQNPIIIVSPCRYQDNGEKVDLALRAFKRIDIELDSLSFAESARHIKNFVGLEEIPRATLSLIFERSMGNPLFIEQFISYLLENENMDDQGVITGEVGYQSTFSISDIISSRIDRLTGQVGECMFNASVLGLEFNVNVLSQMLKADPALALETGIKRRVWYELDELRYIFSHILIKDVVYQRMMSEKLQSIHRAAAEAMEIVYTDTLDKNAEEIAMHFEKGLQLSKAAQYYHKAGMYYWSTFTFERSAQNLQKAISVWKEHLGTQSIEYAKSLFSLALLKHYMQDFSELETIYRQVLEIKQKYYGKDSPKLTHCINNLGRFYKDVGRYSEAERLLMISLEIEKIRDPGSSEVADRRNNLGHLYLIQKKYDEAESMLLQAKAELIERYKPDFWFLGIVLGNLGSVYLETKRYSEAEPLFRKARAIIEKNRGAEHPSTAIWLVRLADLFFRQDKYQEAEPLYLKALDILENSLGTRHTRTVIALRCLVKLYEKVSDSAQKEYFQAKLSAAEKESD